MIILPIFFLYDNNIWNIIFKGFNAYVRAAWHLNILSEVLVHVDGDKDI